MALSISKNFTIAAMPLARRTIRRKDSKHMESWLQKVDQSWGYYLSGFTDGEGSFNVSLRKRDDHTLGWQVVLCFNVSQKESYILSQFKKILGCGALRQRKIDGLFMYSVTNPLALKEKVIPFFRRFGFLSQTKKRNFQIFCQITDLVFQKEHLTESGLKQVLSLREALNEGRGRKRKYCASDVKNDMKENPQRLYAKPRSFREERMKKI